jgi:transcriptional regulator with XRE-family HTH domain
MTISPQQSRAARGLLDWSQTELGVRANLSESTIRDFEKGRRVPAINNLTAIRAALEAAGVEFTNGDQPGVRLRKRDLAKGIGAYRVLVELPDDVSDDELRPLVSRLLSDASQSQVSVDTIAFEIAQQIAAHFPRAVATQQDRMKLAEAMLELARAKRS